MVESSMSSLDAKAVRRSTPQPEGAGSTPSSSQNHLRPHSGHDRYQQQNTDVAGPSRTRPASGASIRSHQPSSRVPEDEHDLTPPAAPSRIGTPSIERQSYIEAPPRGASNLARGRSQKRKSREKRVSGHGSGDESGSAVPAPISRGGGDDTVPMAWGDVEHSDEDGEEEHSRPSTGKWLSKKTAPATTRSPHDPGPSGLDELDAPEPVQDRSDTSGWEMHRHMEDDRQSLDHSQQSALPPPSFARRQSFSGTESTLPPLSSLATTLYTYSYLICFSILGTLARLGMQWLTFYPGAPLVTSVTWANVAGSLFMGFLSEDRRVFREEWGNVSRHSVLREKQTAYEDYDEAAARKNHAKVKKSIPLYIGLATGFCGSFTSFSSFQRDVFLALSNNLPTPVNHPYTAGAAPSFTSTVHRNGGYSFLALLAVMLYTVALSLGALFVGAHIAIALDPWTPTLPFRFIRNFLDRIVLVIAPLAWLGAVFLAIWPPDRPSGPSSRGTWANEVWRGEVLFALVFAPLGCLLRYVASIKLNPILSSFPLGTFTVNIFGCAIEAMCYDIQHISLLSVGGMIGGGRVGCQVLQGTMDGFCGCLTTVSTWVAELQGLRRRHAYVYGVVSLLVGLGVMTIIMGSVRWSVGWSEPACVTMRTSM